MVYGADGRRGGGNLAEGGQRGDFALLECSTDEILDPDYAMEL